MSKVIRWLIGLALIAKGVETLTGAANGSGYGVMGIVLFAFAFLIVGAIVLSPELAGWAASPFTRFIDSIYLPGGTVVEKPEPNYRLADHYYRIKEYDLAISEYEKVLQNHPRETHAYIALVDLWANRKEQPAKASRVYRRGLRKIRQGDGRRDLRKAYRSGDAAALVLVETEGSIATLGGRVIFPDLRG